MATEKVTYLNLSAESGEVHARLDESIASVRAKVQRTDAPLQGEGESAGAIESRSPFDTRLLLARYASSTSDQVAAAVGAARAARAAWRCRPWQERADIVGRAARLVRERSYELAAWLIFETGKNRIEALGEIEETADLYDYYAEQMRRSDGYVRAMSALSPADTNTSVMRPHGVWAVIAPFNFPYALLGAPIAAALVTGNTVVCKASEETPVSGDKIASIFREAGVPDEALQLVVGGGGVGAALAGEPGIDGITFTGSYDVGFKRLFQRFSVDYPRPCIAEMGGKNAAIVMDSADVDRAVSGVYRSAFGMSGQKCSSCSRVFVHEAIAEKFIDGLVARAETAKIGDPTERDTFMGPLGTRAGYRGFQRYAALAREAGRVRTGGSVVEDANRRWGFFVTPTVVTDLPHGHELATRELFVPLVCVEPVASLEQALSKANDSSFGLTAGFFSARPEEVETFLDRIEAGVVYVNRAAGATTGAWPGVQPFGGWKGSGSTGRNIGGLYSLTCYLREQSRTLTH